jgi:hypothetical protein
MLSHNDKGKTVAWTADLDFCFYVQKPCSGQERQRMQHESHSRRRNKQQSCCSLPHFSTQLKIGQKAQGEAYFFGFVLLRATTSFKVRKNRRPEFFAVCKSLEHGAYEFKSTKPQNSQILMILGLLESPLRWQKGKMTLETPRLKLNAKQRKEDLSILIEN